ncbi:hypothetical protein OAM37_04195 [bacterium]|nr:hypothetical protein [bacterium]
MTNFTNYQGELDVSGRLIAPTGTQQTIGTLQTAEQSRCTTEQTGSRPLRREQTRVTNTLPGYRLPGEAFYFHRKGAPPLRLMLPIARTPRKDLDRQFARVDDFGQSSDRVFAPALPDSVGFQAERTAKTA